jgi:hypothetical protein
MQTIEAAKVGLDIRRAHSILPSSATTPFLADACLTHSLFFSYLHDHTLSQLHLTIQDVIQLSPSHPHSSSHPYPDLTYAGTPGDLTCSRGIYKELLPLSAYPPAMEYCSANYPVPGITCITWVTVTATPAPAGKRAPKTPEVKPTPAVNKGNQIGSKLLSRLEATASEVISTACSCIENAPATTVSNGCTTLALLWDYWEYCCPVGW